MNVRTLCLAILNCGDSTGYEIRKLVSEGHFSHFVDASYGSIYPALNRMEQEGLVVSRQEEQEGKPNRKVYSITSDGQAEFSAALTKPAQKDLFKSEFLLLAMCAELMDPEALSRAIDEQLEYLKAELALIDAHVEEVDMAGANWVGDYGRACLSSALNYLLTNRADLEEIAKQARAKPVLIAAE